jgi:hypothetical protein
LATITSNAPAAGVAQAPAVPVGNRRVGLLRSVMLALVSASIAFGVLAGLVAWQANVATYTAYHTIVDEGSVSVDAALRARAALLDHMSASATFLETTGQTQQEAAARAQERWNVFNNEFRVSWRNVTDATHGESDVYAAADRAASDYIQQIGAMYAYYGNNQREQAGAAFLAARETLNTRLIPALGGLEAVKVEAMEATYAGASQRISSWRDTVLIVGLLLAAILVAALFAVRRMRYRWSWPIGIALGVTLAVALWIQSQIGAASYDARVLVREAYDSVAGVQDLSALLSQGRALDSIVIFDPDQANAHLASFDQYNALVEQRLCGPRDCTAQPFLSGTDTVAQAVKEAAEDEKDKLGLPHNPLIANVFFPGQATRYERLRADYRSWLDAHRQLETQVRAGQLEAAAATSTGASAASFSQLEASAADAVQVARSQFDRIWQSVYFNTGLGQILAVLFPLSGLLAAWGLLRRRGELFA